MKLIISILILATLTASAIDKQTHVRTQCQICGEMADGKPKRVQHSSTDSVSDPLNLLITKVAILKCPNGHEVLVPETLTVPKRPTSFDLRIPRQVSIAESPKAVAAHSRKIPLRPPLPSIVWTR